MTDLIGQTLGSYRLEALLGTGVTGQVYRARHVRLDRPAAVSVLDARLTATVDFQSRFMDELRRAAALRHPHIVAIEDFGEQGGRYYVAMEALDGGSLRILLERERREHALPLAAALDLISQAADGLSYAHQQGAVHGAIMPENLLLYPVNPGDGQAYALKIGDFGVARLLPEEALSAPAYLSPEQCSGQQIDARSDIYSLGIVLYELTVGAPPFAVTTVAEAAQKHMRTQPTPPRVVRSQLPTELEAIILRCLAKQPQDRFASAGALADALRQVIRELAPTTVVAPGDRTTQPPSTTPIAAQQAPDNGATPFQRDLAAPEAAAPPPGGLSPDDPLLAGLLGASPATGPATQAWGSGRIAMRIDQEQIVLTPGKTTAVSVRLVNMGTSIDAFMVSVEGVPGVWLGGQESPIQLGPGAETAITLLVTVPRVSASRAGDYMAVVRARSTTIPGESGTARMRWTVLPYAATSLKVAPERAEGRDEATYQVTLRNEGNAPSTYLLSAEDSERALDYAFAQNQATLDPGQTAAVALRVQAPQRWMGSPEPHTFQVRADPPDREPVKAAAQFVHLAVVPMWVLPTLLGLILLAVLIGGGLLGGQPSGGVVAATSTPTSTPTPEPGAPNVALFAAEPQVVAPGQPVTVAWDVRNAERVTIDQFGDVPPQGQREYRPEQTTDFRLVATGGGKETVRIARVNVAPPTAEASAIPSATPPPTSAATNTPIPTETPQPTAAPTSTPQPTAAPTSTPLPPPAPVSLLDQAPDARWSTGAGSVGFGKPLLNADRGGWADYASNVTLEDGSQYAKTLYTFPLTDTTATPRAVTPAPDSAPYIDGQYDLDSIQPGQFFLADIGFAQESRNPGVTVRVSFDGEVLYEAQKQPDGKLAPIRIDLSRFAGRAGRLDLRVSASGGPATDGLYWVQPRIDVPGQ